MQRPGSHVLFSVLSLSLVVGPAKVPHPLLTSQVLDRLRLGTSGGSLCLWEGGKKGWFDQTLQLDRQPIRSRAEWCCLKIFSQFFSLLCKLNQSLVSDAQWKHISLKRFHLPDFDFGTFFGNGVSAGFHTALGRDCMGRAQGDYFYGCQVPNLRLLFLGCH